MLPDSISENLPSTAGEAKKIGSRFFFTGRPCKRGHISVRRADNGYCRECANSSSTRWYKASPENRKKNRENVARWRREYPDRAKRSRRNQVRQRRKWRTRTPAWADVREINDFISGKPDGYHLDHIIPMCGKDVCGLHILENLQFIPAELNIKKSNKVIPATLEACICPLGWEDALKD